MKSKKETRDTRKGTLCQEVKRDTKVGWLIWINGNAWMAEEWMWNTTMNRIWWSQEMFMACFFELMKTHLGS